LQYAVADGSIQGGSHLEIIMLAAGLPPYLPTHSHMEPWYWGPFNPWNRGFITVGYSKTIMSPTKVCQNSIFLSTIETLTTPILYIKTEVMYHRRDEIKRGETSRISRRKNVFKYRMEITKQATQKYTILTYYPISNDFLS